MGHQNPAITRGDRQDFQIFEAQEAGSLGRLESNAGSRRSSPAMIFAFRFSSA
jgi:hypothetical protein